MTPPLEVGVEGADVTSPLNRARDCLLNTTWAACTALQSLVLLTAASTASADQVSPNDAVIAVLSNSQAIQASLSETLAGQSFAGSFISEIRDGLGSDISAETENTLTVLEAQTQTFIWALSAEIDAAEEPSGERTYRSSMERPDALILAAAFLDSDNPSRIQMIQAHANGASINDAVTQVLAHLGESRASMEEFYAPRFMSELSRVVPRENRPNHDAPDMQLDAEAYIAQLVSLSEQQWLYNAYIQYLWDQNGLWFEANMTEPQFYAVLSLAQSSFDAWEWDERDDERRHAGKTRIAMHALMTQEFEGFNRRVWEFFQTIWFEQASLLHPEIRIAFDFQQAWDARLAEIEAAWDARLAEIEAEQWRRTRELLWL